MRQIQITRPVLTVSQEEAYRTLSANIQFLGDDIRVIAATSCMPHEGASHVVLAMALSLAESGKSVLLLDADLRDSAMGGLLGARQEAEEGLSQLLSGQMKTEDVLCQTSVPGLQVIFSGGAPFNPAELLSSGRFKSLCADVRKTYDYVIVDTPPLGQVIDAAVAAACCDGAVLVVETGVTSRRLAEQVMSQLERSGCEILGAVLNDFEAKRSDLRKYGSYRSTGSRKRHA